MAGGISPALAQDKSLGAQSTTAIEASNLNDEQPANIETLAATAKPSKNAAIRTGEILSTPMPPLERGDFNKTFSFEKCEVTQTDKYVQAAEKVFTYSLNPRSVPKVSSDHLSRAEVRDVQRQLHTLGFDIAVDGIQGRNTTLAIMKFQSLYGPIDNDLEVDGYLNPDTLNRISYYAQQAEKDAAHYDVPAYAMAAIRLAEIRVGADFEFMTDLARQESSFRKNVRAGTSSASGMYQFTIDTWLNNTYRVGCDYGFQDYADMISYELEELSPWQIRNDREARIRPTIKNDFHRVSILKARNSHFHSTLGASENSKYEIGLVESFLGRELKTNTEKYIVHFLGIEDSYFFFKAYDENPNAIAADLLEEPARANRHVFYDGYGRYKQARTYAEVYAYFDKKFTTARYAEDYAFQTYDQYQRSLYAQNDYDKLETPPSEQKLSFDLTEKRPPSGPS